MASAFKYTSGAMIARPEEDTPPASQPLERVRQDQESAVARRAKRRAIAVGMLVENVIADAHVNGDGNGQSVGGGQNTQVTMRILAGRDAASQVFAETQIQLCGFAHPIIQLTRFAPQTELAAADVA